MTRRMRESYDPVAGTYRSPFCHYNPIVISHSSSLMMETAGFAETPVYIYQTTRHHIQNSLSFFRLLPQFLTAAFYCNPQAAFFCILLSFHFQNMAIARVCWMRGIRKRERDFFFYKKKASFRISRFDSFSLLRQQRDRTWSISLSEPSQQSQHRLFLPLSPSITPTTHPQPQNLRSSSPYISSLGLVREVALTK